MIHTLWHYDCVDCLIALKAGKSGEGRKKERHSDLRFVGRYGCVIS